MHLRNKWKLIITLFGMLSFAVVSNAQEASEKPASELYRNTGLERRGVKPVMRPTSPGTDSKNLPSSKRVITPPKSKTAAGTPQSTRTVLPQEGTKNLPSNNPPVNPKNNRQRRVVPVVPQGNEE